jgi:hypothetical protein
VTDGAHGQDVQPAFTTDLGDATKCYPHAQNRNRWHASHSRPSALSSSATHTRESNTDDTQCTFLHTLRCCAHSHTHTHTAVIATYLLLLKRAADVSSSDRGSDADEVCPQMHAVLIKSPPTFGLRAVAHPLHLASFFLLVFHFCCATRIAACIQDITRVHLWVVSCA